MTATTLLKTKKPRTVTVDICLDDEIADKTVAMRVRVEQMKVARVPAATLQEAARELLDLEREQEEHTLTLRFRALGRHGYDDLVSQYPPTDEQIAQHRKDVGDDTVDAPYDEVLFPPVLIAASIWKIDDDIVQILPEEDEFEEHLRGINEWMDTLNNGEILLVWTAAIQAQTTTRMTLGNA